MTGVQFEWAFEEVFEDGTQVTNRMPDLPGWLTEQPDDRQEYLAQLREFRAGLLDKAARIERTARRLKALRTEVCADALDKGAVPLLVGAAAEAAKRDLDVARELRGLASLVAIHGPAGKDAESAARGNFARVLSFALGPVPQKLRARFIAMVLEDLNFGTHDTYRDVYSILAARKRRSSS